MQRQTPPPRGSVEAFTNYRAIAFCGLGSTIGGTIRFHANSGIADARRVEEAAFRALGDGSTARKRSPVFPWACRPSQAR